MTAATRRRAERRVPSGEIDLIARRGRVLVAVEVRARAAFDTAADSISAHQRRRIVRALEHFLARHPHLSTLDRRFDVVMVVPRHWPRHLCGAWQGEG